MDARMERGRIIADTCTLTPKGATWFVPSQNTGGSYAVRMNNDNPTCTCPDYELREMKCKHIFAVEITRNRYLNRDGSTTAERPWTPSGWRQEAGSGRSSPRSRRKP